MKFFALCCHSLKNGWSNQKEVITKCFDAIPGDEPVASIAIGTGLVGVLSGADFALIKAGMKASKKIGNCTIECTNTRTLKCSK